MKVIVLGSSGSVGAPGNPASGYLIQPSNGQSLLMDIGPGVLAKMQEYQNPNDAHMLFSHLHPDHCLDFPSLLVWRRYHPTAPAQHRNICMGPHHTPIHLGRLSADIPNEVDDMSDTFDFHPWHIRHPHPIGDFTVTAYPTIHPIESYAMRVTAPNGRIIAYSGDSAYSTELIDCARNADIFLCEANWGKSCDNKAPNMHMCGQDAGIIATKANAKHLILVHIPPWGDPNGAMEGARQHYDGPISLSYSGMEIPL